MPPSSSLMYLRSHVPASVSISSTASSKKQLELFRLYFTLWHLPSDKSCSTSDSQIHPHREVTVGWVGMTLD